MHCIPSAFRKTKIYDVVTEVTVGCVQRDGFSTIFLVYMTPLITLETAERLTALQSEVSGWFYNGSMHDTALNAH
jgi:hypothetical protein